MAATHKPHHQQPQRHTFILRLWQEGDGRRWNCWIQHVQTGEAAAVLLPEELLTFVERWTGKLTQPARRGLK